MLKNQHGFDRRRSFAIWFAQPFETGDKNMQRRDLVVGTVIAALGAAILRPAWAQSQPASVTGPISGGRRGNPLGAYPKDLGKLGYLEEEYFISGEARSFKLSGEDRLDGKWTVAPTGQTMPYTTRLLVHKPADPRKFNGTVIVEWINVSPGNDNILVSDDPIYEEGFVYVGVSAQAVGVHGFPDAKPGFNNGLTTWDPERYRALSHPGDAYSYDIFHQVARTIKNPGGNVNPLRGLSVRKVIGTGASQSAVRLRSYINGVHPIDPVYDAFVPFLDFGITAHFENAGVMATISAMTQYSASMSPAAGRGRRIRNDLNVPVLVVNTEREAPFYRGAGEVINQPDTDRFRLWEVAGAPHSPDLPTIRGAIAVRDGFRRDVGDSPPGAVAVSLPGSHVTSWHCTIAGLCHMHNWINGGAAPPHSPRIRFIDGNLVLRDSLGISTGGIRLPEVEAPIEINTGWPDDAAQRTNRGVSRPFPSGTLQRLYASHDEYVAKVTAAAKAVQAAGFIRPYRVQQYIQAALSARVPPAAAG
jgi:hypothetical protein